MKKQDNVVVMHWRRPDVTIKPELRKQIWKIFTARIWLCFFCVPLYATTLHGPVKENLLVSLIELSFLYAIFTVMDAIFALWYKVFAYSITEDGILLIGRNKLSCRRYAWKKVGSYSIHPHSLYSYLREISLKLRGDSDEVLLSFNPSEVNEAEFVAAIEAKIEEARKPVKTRR